MSGSGGGGGPGVRTPFLAHDEGFLKLGPKLDPLLDPLFLLVDLRWTPLFKKSWIRPCLYVFSLYMFQKKFKKLQLF